MCILSLTFGCISCWPSEPSVENVSPGTFVGTWAILNHDSPCTATVKEIDSNIRATISNDSTMEVLTLFGYPGSIPIDSPPTYPVHNFFIDSLNSNFFDDTDKVGTQLYFSADGNSLYYYTFRGQDIISIVCNRK